MEDIGGAWQPCGPSYLSCTDYRRAVDLRTTTRVPSRPINAAWYEPSVVAVRAVLGAATFVDAWEANRALLLEVFAEVWALGAELHSHVIADPKGSM